MRYVLYPAQCDCTRSNSAAANRTCTCDVVVDVHAHTSATLSCSCMRCGRIDTRVALEVKETPSYYVDHPDVVYMTRTVVLVDCTRQTGTALALGQ